MAHALTIWQPWATLIMIGAKPYEFRKWAAPGSHVGDWIVIHAGARSVKLEEVEDLLLRLGGTDDGTGLREDIARPFLAGLFSRMTSGHSRSAGRTVLPLAAGLGTAVLGNPRRATAIFSGGDSTRVDHHVWAWPLSDVQTFAEPIPARGAQGFWPWMPEIFEAVAGATP